MHIERVKKYVLSILACAVLMLHSLAVAVLGTQTNGAGGSRPGLFVMSVLLGAFGIVLVRAINRLPVLTPWLLTAPVIPTVVYVLYFQVIA
ncbi:hypothetical protein [Nocardioides sp. Iso805N]|uniref:hypothetical protein n=1 Tax=Nocardioides sp. Iso805N TaxID=1283287 RepID=UPI0003605722|nr:hypothetical protein [Nocardioides sp. Iso805N]